jgi:hypothetical protein
MVFFPVYAVLVWYFALKWRRRWPALGVVAAGLAGVVLIWLFHSWLNVRTHGRINVWCLRMLLAPYGMLVTCVALYLAALPRRPIPDHCRLCEYDLRGLVPEPVCPECGRRHSPLPGVDHVSPAVENAEGGAAV